MKKISFLLTFCLFGLFAFAQPYNWTSANSGNWSTPATWNNVDGAPHDYPSTADDIVVIKNHDVTTDFGNDGNELTVQSIEIDNETGVFGTLTISPSDTVATTGDVNIKSGQYIGRSRIILNGGGGLKVGDSPEDGFIINGAVTASGESKIMVSGYYKHETGKIAFAGTMTINISTAGAIPSTTEEHNFYIGPAGVNGAEYDFGSGTVNLLITINNGNLSSKEEVYLENATITDQSDDGYLITFIGNVDGTDNSYAMKTDLGLGDVGINIGANATMTYDHINYPPADEVVFRQLYLFSGKFEMLPNTALKVDESATFF